ncbi:MAG: efflux RND transporter periplasmic adaptor subunit [Microscillaceae bacterium]
MKNLNFILFVMVGVLAACGGGGDALSLKKAELAEKRKQIEQLQADVRVLEKEILAQDPNFRLANEDATLVTTAKVLQSRFESFVEVQGAVESDRNIEVTAETSGLVRSIPVREGQFVGAGQLLVVQGSQVIANQIAELQTRLELAQTVYQKRKTLWDQKIGTELQYLEAKNNVESLQRQIDIYKAQVGQSNVYAPFAGIVEEIIIRPGQTAMPGSPLLRLVSADPVQVKAEISEKYIGKLKVGDPIQLFFPTLDKEITANITRLGQTINPENRTFTVEVQLSNPERLYKPEMLAVVKVQDYRQEKAVVVPTNLIQRDKVGDFIFVLKKDGKKTLARKVRLTRGKTYAQKTEVLEGLQGDEVLIDQGYRQVVDGEKVKVIDAEKTEKIVKTNS